MRYVSCAGGNIYRNGSWYDDPTLFREMMAGEAREHAPETGAELFPPYQSVRDLPSFFGEEDGQQQVLHVARNTNETFFYGAATALARVRNASVRDNIIYLLDQSQNYVVYETYKPNDRAVLHLRDQSELRSISDYLQASPLVAYIWIGSAGCTNYGHWLVDDLPRLKGCMELRRMRPIARIVVLTPDVGSALNIVHLQTIQAICNNLEIENIDVRFVKADTTIFVEELYFVTPPTNHPVLKSPDALRFVRDHARPSAVMDAKLPKRLFVKRKWTGRRDLANQEEISALLQQNDFVSIETDVMPFALQQQLFAGAELVVGCMGAAMTNTLFSDSRTRIGHLAPQSWIETFYWDLAAMRRQHYSVCFGRSTPTPGDPWQKNYRVNPVEVMAMIDYLVSAPDDQEGPAKPTVSAVDVIFNPFGPRV